MEVEKSKIRNEHLNGIYVELAGILGFDVVLKIYQEFRGQQINFPVRLFSQQYIVDQIIENHDGNNIKALATRYGYSERWIRQILRDNINKKRE